jgi:hypothetical protein
MRRERGMGTGLDLRDRTATPPIHTAIVLPSRGLETFYLDNWDEPFEIRARVLADGRINTAFPN